MNEEFESLLKDYVFSSWRWNNWSWKGSPITDEWINKTGKGWTVSLYVQTEEHYSETYNEEITTEELFVWLYSKIKGK